MATAFRNFSDAVVWTPSHTKKERTPPQGVQIIITTPGRFHYIPPELLEKVGTLAIDEAPLVCCASCLPPLLSLRPRFIIGCTATLHRRDQMEVILDYLYGPAKVISRLDIPVRVIRVYTKIKVPYYPGRAGRADWDQHTKFLCSNEIRNALIIDLARKIISAPDGKADDKFSRTIQKISERNLHKIAMLTTRVEEHIEVLLPLLKKTGLSCDYLTGKKHKYNDCDVVLGTPAKMGIGFDAALSAKNYDGEPIDVVFQLISSATEDLVIQQLGRGCRVSDGNPAIFIMLIDQNRISTKHASIAEQALKQLDDVKFFNIYAPIED